MAGMGACRVGRGKGNFSGGGRSSATVPVASSMVMAMSEQGGRPGRVAYIYTRQPARWLFVCGCVSLVALSPEADVGSTHD